MSGRHQSTHQRLSSRIRKERKRRYAGAQLVLGVNPRMYRVIEKLYHIAVLAFSVYLIEATTLSVELSVGVGVFLIGGMEAFEEYLARTGETTTENAGNGDRRTDGGRR